MKTYNKSIITAKKFLKYLHLFSLEKLSRIRSTLINLQAIPHMSIKTLNKCRNPKAKHFIL